jgi:hypothetical protein
VQGGVGSSLHLTVPSMNRLNQTEQHFQFCRVGLSLGILIFSILYTLLAKRRSVSIDFIGHFKITK